MFRFAQHDTSARQHCAVLRLEFLWNLELGIWSFRQLLFLIGNALENSFAVGVKIYYHHLGRFAVGPDGKSNAAHANLVFAFGPIRERVALIMFHWKCFV